MIKNNTYTTKIVSVRNDVADELEANTVAICITGDSYDEFRKEFDSAQSENGLGNSGLVIGSLLLLTGVPILGLINLVTGAFLKLGVSDKNIKNYRMTPIRYKKSDALLLIKTKGAGNTFNTLYDNITIDGKTYYLTSKKTLCAKCNSKIKFVQGAPTVVCAHCQNTNIYLP